ncbi:MAG: very short patch repair endonuclease [Candidatus Woesearchaeota archaeon]
MTDWLDKVTRSKIMSSIRSRDTKPELMLRKALWGCGFSYQPSIAGKPDFIHRKAKIAIFVHGCFWHKCPKCYREPQSNRNYWLPKLKKNVARDKKNRATLEEKGYKVIEIWEHEIKKDIKKVNRIIRRNLKCCSKKCANFSRIKTN